MKGVVGKFCGLSLDCRNVHEPFDCPQSLETFASAWGRKNPSVYSWVNLWFFTPERICWWGLLSLRVMWGWFIDFLQFWRQSYLFPPSWAAIINKPPICISCFSYCYDKIPEKRSSQKESCVSVAVLGEDALHHGRVDTTAGAWHRWSHCLCSQEALRDNAGTHGF